MSIIVGSNGGGNSGPVNAGWANYINGAPTPIATPAGVPIKMTLDALSGSIIDECLPAGVSDLWNSTTSQFDFSSLDVGDMVDIRVDGTVTTTTLNDSASLSLTAGVGSPSEFIFPFDAVTVFAPGTFSVSSYNGIFIGSEDIRDNPAELKVTTSDVGSAFLIDIYIKVTKA